VVTDSGPPTVVAPPAGVASPAASGIPPTTPPSTGQALDPAAHRKRNRRRGVVALVVVLLLAIGAGAFAWWLGEGRYATVPRVTGLTAEQATKQLEAEGLEVAFADEEFSEIVKAGEVITSDPKQGAEIESGGTVTLTVSKGPERYDVPKVAGLEVAEAKERVKRNHELGDVTREYSDTVAAGVVISSQPEEGQSVSPDTKIDLVVSKGPPPVPVPDLSGDTLVDARAELRDLELKLTQSGEEYDKKVPAGSIISQDPSAGVKVPRGSTISVVVSLGPPLVEVPNVVDMPVDEAIARLEELKFEVEVYEPFGISPLNRVASQDPEGGSDAPLGSTVRLGII
jgi:serine/threonine-protein kinase